MNIPMGAVSLYVTSVDIEGPFFVVYGQSEKNAIERVNPLLKGYISHFERGIGAVTDPKQISVGLVCIGKNADLTYYRVKILSIDQRNHQVEAFFIDYGNRATMKFSDLRIFSPSKTSFLSEKPLCTKYILSSGVLVAGKEDDAIDWIQPYIVGEETYAKIVDPRIPAIDLSFQSNGTLYNATGSLLHKGFFTQIAAQDQYYMYQNIVEHKIPIQQFVQPPPLAPSAQMGGGVTPPVFREPPHKQRATQSALPSATAQPFIPAVAAPSVTRDLKPQSDALLHGHIYQVVVSYVDEENMTVSVHKKEDFDKDLRALMSTINDAPPIPYPSILEPGAYVLARAHPRDMLLRAVVFQLGAGGEDRAQVYFVDFGHRAFVSLDEIYALPPEVAAVKNMAHRCHLAGLEQAGPWSREVRDELEEITKEKVLNMKILTSALRTKRTVALSFADDNRSVVDVLAQQLKPLMFESVHIPKGQSVEVVVSHALSASRFFVQLTANQAALDSLMHQVHAHCLAALADPPPATPCFTEQELVSGNLPCCARFADDGRWYRAIITDYEPTRPTQVTVRYVDFGNESAVDTKDILPIPRALMKVRTQAVECALAGHSSRRATDLEEAQFQALLEAQDYTFLMSIKMHLVGAVLLVELWDVHTKNSVRHTLEAMVQAAQKAKPPTPVKTSPDTGASHISASSNIEAKNSFARKAPGRDWQNSSDESDGAATRPARQPRAAKPRDRQSGGEDGGRPPGAKPRDRQSGSEDGGRPAGAKPRDRQSGSEDGGRPAGAKSFGGADSNDWRKKRDDDSSGERRKPRFGERADYSRPGGEDKGDGGRYGGDGSRYGGASRGENYRAGGGDRGDRFGGGERGGGNRFGGGDVDSRPPPRKPRYGDENDRTGGGGSFGSASGDDKSYGGENKFRSAGGGDKGGWKSGGGGGREERGGGGFRKREDFTSDNWGAAKSFDSSSRSFPTAKPERPKLLNGYPAGGRVPTLPALGALDPPRTVAVTHYESPLSFFLQLQDSHQSFLDFMKGLQSDYIKRNPVPSSEIAVGQHVMAQFKEDRVLYRAEVLTTSPEVKVKFFDYGNESTVPANKVWHLSSEHCALPMQSIPCRLSNIESAAVEEAAVQSWSMDCLQYFAEDNYQMTIRGYDDQNKAEVDLMSADTGLQVSTRLVEAGLCKFVSSTVSVSVEEPVDLPLLLHQSLAVHISHMESSTRFFIHVEPDTPDLIAAKIAELLGKPEELFPLTSEEIAVGKFVLASSDAESWHRARVTGTSESGTGTCAVTFVDYGDSGDVPLENIRDIPEAACDWCPQATECYLASAAEQTPLDEALEAELVERLNDVRARVFVAAVDEAHRLAVVLYSEAGELETKFHPALPPQAPAALPPLLPCPVLRQGESVFISHASAAGLFLQRSRSQAAQELFAAELHGYYSATELPPLENPPLGAEVAARSLAYDSWYRARVESEGEGEVRVHYVDYGNTEALPAGNLRALAAPHCSPPAFSLQATLPAAFVRESYEIFADVDTPFDAVFERRGDTWAVDLIGPEGSLLEKHLMTGQLEVQEPLRGVFVQELSVVDRWVSQGQRPVTVMSLESPAELSISLQEDEARQEELQSRLQAYADRTLPILGACPELCLGKFSEDGAWYRTQVLDAEFRALFVDYGNKDVVPEIRKLSHSLRRLPPLSVRCALPVVPLEAEWSQAAIDRLDALVTDQKPRARILDYDTVPSVELILEDGKSVADVLVEEKLAARKSYKVVISHVNGPDEFYVQYAENAALDAVFRVMETIDTHAPVAASQISEGDVLAAKFPKDEAWYRASVLSKESPAEGEVTVNVLFIDFGNTSEASEFRRLPSSVSRLPPLAKPCALVLPEGNEAWPDFAREKLEQVSIEGAGEFTLTWLDVGKNIVELLTAQNTNVVDILLEPPPLKNYMLSHINSANDFYLQEEDHPLIGTITDLLASLDTEKPLASVSTGDLVAAKFIEDGAWYRARVIAAEPPQVLFIDYGNTSPAAEFRALSDALKNFEPAAIHCSLALPEGATFAEYSRAASDRFVELSQGGETLVTCDFLEAAAGGARPVELYIGEDSVAALLADVPDVSAPAEASANKFTVCWVNSADDFYLQPVNDPSLDIIIDLLEPIAETAAIAVKPGDLVASQFVDDDLWYRSRVLSGGDAASHEVHFVDYGNSATASAFRALPDGASLEAIPARARRYKLADVTDVEAQTGVLTELMDSGRTVEVVAENGRVVLVDEDGKRLTALLAEEEAVATTVADGETATVSPTKTSVSKDASPVKEAGPSSPPTSPIKASSPTRAPSTLKEKARASAAQKVHVITHVNSPSDFYLMLDAEAAILIGKLLNGAADFEPVHSVIGGATYAAFNEREDSWHRAQLIELLGDDDQGQETYLVKYRDLGNTDVVTKDELRELPEEFRDLPDVVKHCALDTPEPFVLWSEPAVRKLSDLVVMGQFLVETREEGDPARVLLRTTDGVDVNEMLRKIQEATQETQPPPEEMNETLNDTLLSEAPSKNLILQRVTLSHYSTPEDFHVQVCKDGTILDSINSLLAALKPVDPAEVILDEMYAGRESNGDLWFRVLALSPRGAAAYAVQRIDYGDEDTCTELKRLSDDLKHISPLAHHCRVADASLGETLAAWHEKKTELVVVDMEASAGGQPVTVVLSEDTQSGEPADSVATEAGDKATKVNGGTTNGFSNGDAESPTKSQCSPVKQLGKSSTPIVSPVKDSAVVSPTKENVSPKNAGAVISPTKSSAIITPTEDPVVSPTKERDEVKVNTSLDDTFVSCVSEKTIIEDTMTEEPAEVYILSTNAIDDFYVHLETDTAALEEMTEALRDVTDLTHPLVPAERVKLNELYVCLYEEDSLYYRARVLSSVADRFRVLFVDYGNESEVSELRHCPAHLASDEIAPIAKHCEFLKPTAEGASVDLSPSGPLGKQFEAFDTSALDLKLKSLTPLGADKFAIEIVIAESGENVLTYLAALSEDVDK